MTLLGEVKTCGKCKREQHITNFSKSNSTLDGLRWECKNCNKQYKDTHKENYREHNKQYKDTHKEQLSEYQKQYNATHKEQISEYHKQYRDTHKKQISERQKQYFATHKEQISEYKKQYKDTHKEQISEYGKQYKDTHKEQNSAHAQIRRARKAGLLSTLTPKQWKHILDSFNNTCAYCGVGDKKLHQEHFIPVLEGGVYTHNNIIPACGSCNSSKGSKSFWEWYPTFKHYSKEREKKILKILNYTGNKQQLRLCI